MNSTRLGPPRGNLLAPDAAPRTDSAPSSTVAASPDDAPLRSPGASAQSSGYAQPSRGWRDDSLAVRARIINPFVLDESSGAPHSDQAQSRSLSPDAAPSSPELNATDLNRILLDNLERNPELSWAEQRASHLDKLVAIVLDGEAQVSATDEARQRIVSFVNRDDVANERLEVLAEQIDATARPRELDSLAGKLRALRQVLQPGQTALAAIQLQQRLEARRAELDTAGAGAGAPLQRQTIRRDPLQPFAELMDNPASKVKVGDLPVAAALVRKYGEEIAEASYLIPENPSAPVFRLGKTVDNGGFSKIRDFVDEDGNYGKMRVLHMHAQRQDRPKIGVHVTPPRSFLRERKASSKAGSPVAFDQAFSVVSGRREPVLKLYVPLPALGIESRFFGDGVDSFADRHPPRKVAAALRAYLASINNSLLALHRDDAQGEGMVHSDIKPGNVLISAQGEVNLIDFGLAKPTRSLQRGGLDGTHGFFAPEYLAHSIPGASPTLYPLSDKLDVWSLAATTLLTFFGRQAEILPQHELVQQADAEISQYLYYGVLQEYWTRDQHDQLRPAHLNKEWASVRPADMDPDAEFALAYAFGDLLDNLRLKFEATDPDLSTWFFQRVYRFDANERYSSAELARALDELPPLHGSAAADSEVARQLFVDAFPRAQAHFEARRTRKFGPSGGPSKEQLAALPAQLPNADVAA